MGGTYSVVVGDKGRIVLPVGLRDRLRLEPGTPLLLVETDDGVVMTTREQALRLLREQLDGSRVVSQLLEERRRASVDEDR
ncbi:MAG: AbrB/MazE/SpoVT family DNA-binding domain-containing protein [Frankiales bacterium]|nr:AbrB/MazE/SpoVT family DNA-binding domain-containing protein [Frankiales bacterium]